MGMILGLQRIDDAEAERLLAEPESIEALLHPDDDADFDPATWTPPDNQTDLDKAWHGLHYLLTGSSWEGEPPFDFLLNGGEEIGEVDVGYGPARAIRAGDVQRIAAALAPLDEDTLRGRFDAAAMTALEIYPATWDRGDAGDLDYLLSYFDTLKAFVCEAAERRQALVLSLF